MSELDRRDLVIRGLIVAAGACPLFTPDFALAGTKDKGSSFHLEFSLSVRSLVGFKLDFEADVNTREMTMQLQQRTRLSTGHGWRPMNMICKSAGSVQHTSTYTLDANQYRIAVGLTKGYTYSIGVYARALNSDNHPVGSTRQIIDRSGRS